MKYKILGCLFYARMKMEACEDMQMILLNELHILKHSLRMENDTKEYVRGVGFLFIERRD